uniref:Uncharacterized protein n=1 Tax=Chromera velia CCMP2878 TaxID=1169474 RepID=A0A0G4IAZ6_9ALVE|eukprot:Cvel_12725.t1-p1 / transcript=Cvel_12725.t1 / gene=Cvel_12725 / organism=Chromera_velia_CCMP2878 / gene_product=hypothetical protein / transcript_product=hypothetical protein / location=Cvel_scaffold845:29093-31064(-) / protein_length=331 / sequence_SO=supercontig / SO=protein_coding / is_pseudo=false
MCPTLETVLFLVTEPTLVSVLLRGGADVLQRDKEGVHWVETVPERMGDCSMVALHDMLGDAVREHGLPVHLANTVLTETIVLKKEKSWVSFALFDEAVDVESDSGSAIGSEQEGEGVGGGEDVRWRPFHIACKNCEKPWASKLLGMLNARQKKDYQTDPEGNSVCHYKEVLLNPDFLAKLLKEVGKTNDPAGWYDRQGRSPARVCLRMLGEYHEEEERLMDEGAEKKEIEEVRQKVIAVKKSYELLDCMKGSQPTGRIAQANSVRRQLIRSRQAAKSQAAEQAAEAAAVEEEPEHGFKIRVKEELPSEESLYSSVDTRYFRLDSEEDRGEE